MILTNEHKTLLILGAPYFSVRPDGWVYKILSVDNDSALATRKMVIGDVIDTVRKFITHVGPISLDTLKSMQLDSSRAYSVDLDVDQCEIIDLTEYCSRYNIAVLAELVPHIEIDQLNALFEDFM